MNTNITIIPKKNDSIKPTSIKTPPVILSKKYPLSQNNQIEVGIIQTTKKTENAQTKFKDKMLTLIQNNFKDLNQEQSTEFAIQLSELRSKLTNKIEFLKSKNSNNFDKLNSMIIPDPQNPQINTRYMDEYRNVYSEYESLQKEINKLDKLYHSLDTENTTLITSLKRTFQKTNSITKYNFENPNPEIKTTTIPERQQKLDKIEENKTEKRILKEIYTKNMERNKICDDARSLFQNDKIKDEDMPQYLKLQQEYNILCEKISNLNNLLTNPINEKLISYSEPHQNTLLSAIIDSEKKNTQGVSSKSLIQPFDLQAIKSKIEELRREDIDLKNQINSEDANLLYNIKSLETQIEALKERYLASNDSTKKNEFSNQIKSLEKEFKLKKELLNNLERVNQGNMYYQMETTQNFIDNSYTYDTTILTQKQIRIYKRDYDKLCAFIKEKDLNIDTSSVINPNAGSLNKFHLKNLRYFLNSVKTYYSREHTEYSFIQQGDSEKAKLVTPSHPDGVIVGNNLSQKTLNNLLKLKENGTVDLSLKQRLIGDCYLLTAMDQILHKEDDLIDFLSCFSEEVVETYDEKGNKTEAKQLVFTAKKGEPPFKMNFDINEDGSIQLKGYFNDSEKAKAGSPIVNIVEEIYTQVRFNELKANLADDDPFKKLDFSEENLKIITDIAKYFNDFSYNINIMNIPEEIRKSKEVLLISKHKDAYSILRQKMLFSQLPNPIKDEDKQPYNIKDVTVNKLYWETQNEDTKKQIIKEYFELAIIQKQINNIIYNKKLLNNPTKTKSPKKKKLIKQINNIYSRLVSAPKFLDGIKESEAYNALCKSITAIKNHDFEIFDTKKLKQKALNNKGILNNSLLSNIVRNIILSPNANIYNSVLSGGNCKNVLNTFLSSSHERINFDTNFNKNLFNPQYENIDFYQNPNFNDDKLNLRKEILPEGKNNSVEHKFYEKEYDKANFGLYQYSADKNKLGLITNHAINSEGILNGIDFNINPWDNDMVLLRTVDQYKYLKKGVHISITRRKKD